MSELYDPSDYPHGCRCGSCLRLFEEGDRIVRRSVGDGYLVDVPLCARCGRKHDPLRHLDGMLLKADGTVLTRVT